MPYISDIQRLNLKDNTKKPGSSGELNYAITMLCVEYMAKKGLRYDTINDIVGALEGAKLEFYRQVASPYEDKKKEENGDVYK